MNKIIIIQGPTASGKSSLALELAQKLNAPIISADSRQFYKELSIGTAKPSFKELSLVEYYFVNSHSILESPVTSADFMKVGRVKIKELFNAGHSTIIVSGGSGMYIDALIDGLHASPNNEEIRTCLHKEWKDLGLTPLLNELKLKDTETYNRIDKKNPARVLRSLEIIRVSGKTLNQLRGIPKENIGYPVKRFAISWDRSELYKRINQRVHQMIDEGLKEEVKHLPLNENHLLQNTVGYKEWLSYDQSVSNLEETIIAIQKNSRNYAKRQETWLKRYEDLISLSPQKDFSLLEQLLKHVEF
jgi:tRNA dimethylallyltransferase